MNFCDNLKKARQRIGLTQQQIANALGITKSTYCGYETGKRQPDIPKLRRLSLLLCTSVDDLLGLIGGGTEYVVSPSEFEQVKLYRALDAHGQRMASMVLKEEHARMRMMLRENTLSTPADGVVPLRIAKQSITCKGGTDLAPDGFDLLSVRRAAVPSNFSFALRVHGDSMEPRFHHHDILLVSEENPQLGDVGIYLCAGLGYLYQVGFCELFPLNPAYPPITPDDGIRPCGRVIGILDTDDLL